MPTNVRMLICKLLLVLINQQLSQSQDLHLSSSTDLNAQLQEAKRVVALPEFDQARAGFVLLQNLARSGNIDAMVEVGMCFREGCGIAKDPHLSYKAFRLAAESGSSEGMFRTARCLLTGDGTPRSNNQALKWLRKAAGNNHAEAICCLTEELWNQYLKDGKCAAELQKWSQKGSEMVLPYCQRALGYCYQHGVGHPADAVQAFHYYSVASQSGDSMGSICLAYCHRDGIGTPVDQTKAILTLHDVARSQDACAIYEFATMLDELVVDKPTAESEFDPLQLRNRNDNRNLIAAYEAEIVRQLRRAVALEYAPAMNLLAAKLADGKGCNADPSLALELAQKSEALGDLEGSCTVAEFIQKGIGTKADPRRAAALYARCAKLGSPLAQYRYSLCLATGNGVRTNSAASRHWMQMSAAQGFADAIDVMEQLNERQMAEVRGWLDSMFTRNIVDDSIQRRIDEYNAEQERSTAFMNERDRIGY